MEPRILQTQRKTGCTDLPAERAPSAPSWTLRTSTTQHVQPPTGSSRASTPNGHPGMPSPGPMGEFGPRHAFLPRPGPGHVIDPRGPPPPQFRSFPPHPFGPMPPPPGVRGPMGPHPPIPPDMRFPGPRDHSGLSMNLPPGIPPHPAHGDVYGQAPPNALQNSKLHALVQSHELMFEYSVLLLQSGGEHDLQRA